MEQLEGFDNVRKLFLHQRKPELPALQVQKQLLFYGFLSVLTTKFRSQLKTHNIVSRIITSRIFGFKHIHNTLMLQLMLSN